MVVNIVLQYKELILKTVCKCLHKAVLTKRLFMAIKTRNYL